MTDTTTRSAKVLRTFNDAGTERRFEQDAIVELSAGEFANYAAAGLVEAADEDAPEQPAEPVHPLADLDLTDNGRI